ncbi:hypothetical protein ACTFIR_010631 [Dictyostelium discoideum]
MIIKSYGINKEKLSSIIEGKYDFTKNSIALGDLGEDKKLIEKAIPLIFILGSIPNSINQVHFTDGFNQPIFKDLIPNNICISLYKYSIINPKIIPYGVEKMNILSIEECALLEESVPDSVKYVFLGFDSDQAYSHFFPSLKK